MIKITINKPILLMDSIKLLSKCLDQFI